MNAYRTHQVVIPIEAGDAIPRALQLRDLEQLAARLRAHGVPEDAGIDLIHCGSGKVSAVWAVEI